MTAHFPLSAIVGQEQLIEALLVNAVDPGVGGVLVRGQRGTAKSTAVRALAPLLPPVEAAVGQAFAFAPGELSPTGTVPAGSEVEHRPAPLVDLPLGATLDRLLGALDLGLALKGEYAFEAGLLARAHKGILYVDEVNLLPDHLVDALLDAAASGLAVVEREAVSVGHATRFLLVGTMNPEEGELRPQLLDRFGLGVTVEAPAEPALRAEIVRRRLAYEADPDAFARDWADADRALAERIIAARALLPRVRLPERELARITEACSRLAIDGVRGDIVSARAARVLAALDGRETVDPDDVRRAAHLALAHRRRRDPLEDPAAGEQELDQAFADDEPDGDDEPPTRRRRSSPPASGASGESAADGSPAAATAQADPGAPARERSDPPIAAAVPEGALRLAGRGSGPRGRAARATGSSAGSIDSRPSATGDDLAVVASLRERLAHGGTAQLHEHVRAGREGTLLCLVVDVSGSMGARRRLARIKGALLALLRDAYVRRDRVALIAFRDGAARVVVEPGAPLEQAAAAVRRLSAGGRTPLTAGLAAAERLIAREHTRDPHRRPIAIVLTDGRVADPDGEIVRAAARLARAAAAVHVIDAEEGPVRLALADTLARAAGGRTHSLVPPPTRRAA